ncbi:hypothetical protein HNQ07_000455 [Deinococcus metalli]|uniref:Uncharacterized protein n=1 Tax=Deinococcus metalli TaxID=1141878 RepID=A0A7W8KBE7_9DEIO|nr:hypothetical protein [Deinococcus metalli]MBB5375011.1 hypothetical protein [Deinococcus metalli]GHF32098.1 hypothetical protein GCM10017781_05870 [Deinococcus metalli]
MKQRSLLALLLALTSAPAATAVSPTTLLVTFRLPAGAHVNARAPSTLVLSAGTFARTVALTGPRDPADRDGNLARLDDVRVGLPVRAGTRVTLQARLYVCDAVAGICTVRQRQQVVTLKPGETTVVVDGREGRENRTVHHPPVVYRSPRT